MWRPAFEVFAPSPVRQSPSDRRKPTGTWSEPSTPASSSAASSRCSTPTPSGSCSPLHPAVTEERLQHLLHLARVSGEGMAAALSRLEEERAAAISQRDD